MEQDAHPPSDVHTLSLNLSYILNYLPSGILTRLRRSQSRHPIDAFQVTSPPSITSTVASLVQESTQWSLQGDTATHANHSFNKNHRQSFPGPWAFFTSGYMLGLLFMAFLLHRMQNIIIPSRIPARRRREILNALNAGRATGRHSYGHYLFVRRIYSSLLPLDVSKTFTRLALHLPSLYVLTKMLILWCLLTLQASNMLPSWSWMQRIGAWSEQKEMSDICWTTFCAVGSAFCVEGFIRALDGLSTTFAFGSSSNPNASPFNLIGYAFLLHIYSSPLSHVYKPSGLPSRPDKHVIITITIPLLQLTIFHYLSIFKRLSTHRLIPTALTSLLSLTHFHLTLFSRFLSGTTRTPNVHATVQLTPSTTVFSALTPSVTIPHTSVTPEPRLISSSGLNSSYPLLNYIPNVFETILLLTILLTVTLNATVQLLVRGSIQRPFIGLGIANHNDDDRQSTGWLASLRRLPWEEDFGVLLLRMSTASLEATGLRGWANEVASVPAPLSTSLSAIPERRQRHGGKEPVYGRVRMGRAGVESLSPGTVDRTPSPSLRSRYSTLRQRIIITGPDGDADEHVRTLKKGKRREKVKEQRKVLRGYHNDVRSIDIGVTEPNEESSRRGLGNNERSRLGRLSFERQWVRAFGIFSRSLWGTLRGLALWFYIWAWSLFRGRRERLTDGRSEFQKDEMRRISGQDLAGGLDSDATEDEEEVQLAEDDLYVRFLRGDDFSEDEDPTFSDVSTGEASDSESDASAEDPQSSEGTSRDQADGTSLVVHRISTWTKLREEAMLLFSDLVDSQLDEDPSTIFAHMAYPRSSVPLTRQRLKAVARLRQQEPMREDGEKDEIESIRSEMMYTKQAAVDQDQERARHLCVICTIEMREIICWPSACQCATTAEISYPLGVRQPNIDVPAVGETWRVTRESTYRKQSTRPS
ncbi:hypothetical protein AX17_005428 [Amanita inopinata Kibby_2008]|nr:hypothetical protein AX17_005428 [Amanita inopinata Kibby_2008]